MPRVVKYFIYEIPGVKIGCTNDFQRRQKQQRSLGKMILLETYTCKEKASKRERELQLEKGYPTDSHDYKTWMNTYHTKSRSQSVRKKAMASIDWESRNNKLSKLAKEGHYRNNKKTSKPVSQYTKDGKFIKTFPSQQEAQRQLSITGINEVVKGKYKTAGGYVWKYV